MVLLFSFRADLVLYLSVILFWWGYVEILIWLKGSKTNKRALNFLPLKQFNNIAILSFWVIMLVTLYLN